MMPRFSICIPAYNRAPLLPALLDSILSQDFQDYEVVICEDASLERDAIRTIAERYATKHPGCIRYAENPQTLGYDGNLRRLVELAAGDYCLFMGNDDLMCPGALSKAAHALDRHPKIGVLIRSYADFDNTTGKVCQEYRYFPEERFFPVGADAVALAFRRVVVIPGMIIHRRAARRFATERFDGSLLYQVWLVSNILTEMNALFVPDILVLRRKGVAPDFGQADAERGRFTPQNQTPESSLHFMQGMLTIAQAVQDERRVMVRESVVSDLASYSYPILSIQASKPLKTFAGYWWQLARMGFGKYPIFHLYFFALLAMGPTRMDRMINIIKRKLGHTPRLGKLMMATETRPCCKS